MPRIHEFQKVTQAMTYIANRFIGERLSRLRLMKLLWAADRYHVRKYGRLVTNPNYVAMKLGPVHSTALNIADEASYGEPYDSYARSYLSKSQYDNRSIQEPDVSKLSKSDIEALEFGIKNFGKMDRWDLSRLTHEYPEWAKHEEMAKITAIDIDPFDFFLDPDPAKVPDDKFRMDAELLEDSKEIFEESQIRAKVLQ